MKQEPVLKVNLVKQDILVDWDIGVKEAVGDLRRAHCLYLHKREDSNKDEENNEAAEEKVESEHEESLNEDKQQAFAVQVFNQTQDEEYFKVSVLF